MAPYWRLAYEKTWDKNSLMFGTIGMYAEQKTGVDNGFNVNGISDPTLDIGVDTQYQWIGEQHAVTVRAAYIWEKKKNNIEMQNGAASNLYDELNDFNISATYIYDRKISFTIGYFNTWGINDVTFMGQPIYRCWWSRVLGIFRNGSPNSSYWKFDLAYLPYMNGGPDLWPWFNARVGILYTHYDKFDGTWKNVDQTGLKAGGNDQVFLYTWLMF